ncbi:hypothetical protein LTSEHVI_0529, partial [Salmonella enterica subsp. enterica serovar Hvittingfoss str. A4-620]
METKTVAITMGDPAGIGPEIIVKALSEDGLNGAAGGYWMPRN